MSVSGQSGVGRIKLFDDFTGAHLPIALTSAVDAAAGQVIGDFRILGDLAEDDTGVTLVDKANGYVRISNNNENGKGVALCSSLMFSPTLNGTMVLETRLERAAITAGVVFAGFCGTLADDVAEPCTSTGTAITTVASHYCGFLLDSQFTDSDQWHMVYNGGTTTGVTLSTNCDASQAAVAGESDILRLEIDNNGTARWYINGVLEQTTENAVSTTTLQGSIVGCWGTTTTAATADLDYILVEAGRDWTR